MLSLNLLRKEKENIEDYLYYPESDSNKIKLFLNNEKLKDLSEDKEFKGNYIEFEILKDNYCFVYEDQIKAENLARKRANVPSTHLLDLNGEVLHIKVEDYFNKEDTKSINPIELKIKGSLLLYGNCIYFSVKIPYMKIDDIWSYQVLNRRIDIRKKSGYFKTEDVVPIKITYKEF